MISNYHSHTWRCNHASGTEEEYVRCAIQRGIKELGFSDHSPYLFPEYHFSHFRMRTEQLADYCETVLSLREKYKSQIEIHLGVEMEFYPDYFDQTLAFLRENGVEYLLLGQHFVGNEINEHYSGDKTGDEILLKRYCDQSIAAMRTGLYTYFAHPDLFHFSGSMDAYDYHNRRMCRVAKELKVPLEINLLGLAERRHYPNPVFWKIAGEEKCQVILGCDAHNPQMLLDRETEDKALDLAREFDLNLIESVPLKRI